jgi:hypothetical protein
MIIWWKPQICQLHHFNSRNIHRCYVFRITASLKVETNIIASITESVTGRAVILVIMYTCMSRPAKQTSLFLSVLNALIWWYTNQYLPVSKSLSWYWQYQSVRSNWKTSKLLIIKIIYPFTTTNEIAKKINKIYW